MHPIRALALTLLLFACNDRDRTLGDGSVARVDASVRSDGGSLRADGGSTGLPDAGMPPPVGECAPIDAGSRVGEVATGTVGASSATTEVSCRPGPRAATWVRWIAPSTASFSADTVGSDFDTLLAIRDGGCDAAEVGCNDDDGGLQSRVVFPATAGRTYLFVIAAFTDGGAFTLNVNEITGNETGRCTDSLDNDGDGVLDCSDTDCASDPACEGGVTCGSRMCTPSQACRDCPGVGLICLPMGMACGLPPV